MSASNLAGNSGNSRRQAAHALGVMLVVRGQIQGRAQSPEDLTCHQRTTRALGAMLGVRGQAQGPGGHQRRIHALGVIQVLQMLTVLLWHVLIASVKGHRYPTRVLLALEHLATSP